MTLRTRICPDVAMRKKIIIRKTNAEKKHLLEAGLLLLTSLREFHHANVEIHGQLLQHLRVECPSPALAARRHIPLSVSSMRTPTRKSPTDRERYSTTLSSSAVAIHNAIPFDLSVRHDDCSPGGPLLDQVDRLAHGDGTDRVVGTAVLPACTVPPSSLRIRGRRHSAPVDDADRLSSLCPPAWPTRWGGPPCPP